MQDRPGRDRTIVLRLIEAAAFAQSPVGKPAVRKAIKREFKVTSDAAADEGVAELAKIIVRKHYPSPERLRNMQRMMRLADPKAAEVDVASLLTTASSRRRSKKSA